MDERLNRALEFANLRNTQSLEKRRLKEKLKVDLTIGYNGGIFFIDRTLIAFLNAITPEEGLGSSTILDEKMNPVLIDDLIKFKSHILNVYSRVTNQYFLDFENLRKKRTVKSLVEL